ncbi:MAG TPA: cell division protein FtsL [Myxococcales bacterium]|jgi:cell division protein FtsL|nr:cell division protein FtsL [Myxococcales bacterium]
MSCAVRTNALRCARAGSPARRASARCGMLHFRAATLACALLAAAALLQIWVRTRVTEQGYRLSRLSAQRQQLVRDHERLQLAAARLGSAQRIEDLARARLGMGPAPADRVIVLVGGALRSSASTVASK